MTDLGHIKASYRSGEDDLVRDFFRPCISACHRYYRAAGYFSSSALSGWAAVLPRLVENVSVEIRLLIAPILSNSDLSALKAADTPEKRAAVLDQLADQILEDALLLAEDESNVAARIRLFQWLIATAQLSLKFAFPQHVESPGIYHEKIGLFEFANGEWVAFTGSANETASGQSFNYESLDVYRSWVEADVERVRIKRRQFDDLWRNSMRGLEVRGLSAETLARVKSHAPDQRPDFASEKSPDGSQDGRWRHQDEAIEIFCREERGVLDMATGTGKTRTALRICNRLLEEGKIASVIVAADGIDLLDQWYMEILQFDGPLAALGVHRHYSKHRGRELYSLNPAGHVLIASRSALRGVLEGLDDSDAGRLLLIHDEVHSLGSPARREALEGLSDKIRFRLGLSATPEREYDSEGTDFILAHIGPVLFEFSLGDAIRRGILVPFDYHPLPYSPTDDDRQRISQVYKRKAAREAAGDPMSDKELWIELARVHKTSEAKLALFEDFLSTHPEVLERCIVFVETREYGEAVLDIIHRLRYDFHTYFSAEDSRVLERFARGEIECLLTCHRLSEGIDIHNIRNIILFSSARSQLETIQRIGRSLRRDATNPNKIATVVDFVRVSDEGDEGRTAGEARADWLQELASIRPGD